MKIIHFTLWTTIALSFKKPKMDIFYKNVCIQFLKIFFQYSWKSFKSWEKQKCIYIPKHKFLYCKLTHWKTKWNLYFILKIQKIPSKFHSLGTYPKIQKPRWKALDLNYYCYRTNFICINLNLKIALKLLVFKHFFQHLFYNQYNIYLY